MPRDERTFITVHDGMPEHPKVEGLSDAAFRLMVTSWCWCSRNHTDGRIRAASWVKRGSKRSRDELLAANLVEATDDGVIVHDYTEHQRTAAEIAELSEKRKEAGAKGGKARALALASASHVAKQTASKVVAESEEVLKSFKSSPAAEPRIPTSTSDPRFVEFWSRYPRRIGKAAAFRKYAAAIRKGVTAETIQAGTERYARQCANADPQFVAHPETWLNAGRWDDEPDVSRMDDDAGWAR